jgi:SepF-like predicted cell division protein (DUF552 family)
MVKCSSCGFENRKADVCARCGSSIQRYVKALPLRNPDDLPTLKEELNSGNVLILNVLPFLHDRTNVKPLENLEKMVLDLKRHALSVGGDAARIGEERVVLTPSPFRIWTPKLQPQKPPLRGEEPLFTECPNCGETVKISNMDAHGAKVHGIPVWAKDGIASIGTMARFFARNFNQLSRLLSELGATDEELKATVSTYLNTDEFAERAMETGKFREIILAVEKLKDEVGGEEIELWAIETQLNILCSWKPGFEEYLSELFFTEEKCRNCKRKHKDENRCREGMSSCVFDAEFEQFEDESLRKIIEQLKKGVEPKEPDVPKTLQEQWIRIRNLRDTKNG